MLKCSEMGNIIILHIQIVHFEKGMIPLFSIIKDKRHKNVLFFFGVELASNW